MLSKAKDKKESAATTTSAPTPKGLKVKDKTPNKSKVTGQKNPRVNFSKLKIKKTTKKQHLTLLLYQDSAPENWKNKLKELHVPFIVSPLHDKDLKQDGTKKKPHYHIIVRFRSKKSFKQIKEAICDPLGGPHPQPVFDFPMMVRYLAHLDDPEKAQYNIEDIEVYGNIDVKQYLYNHQEYQMEILKDILNFCEVYDITEYSTICNYARDERPKWFPYVTQIFRSTVDAYVRSQRYASENAGN